MSEHFSLLEDCGIRVDEDGFITDWQDLPARESRPLLQQTDGSRGTRNAFTPEEDRALHAWCTAAQREGVLSTRVFEQLEVLRPNHTWQAYQTRWRKTLRKLPAPEAITTARFPNLDGTPTSRCPPLETDSVAHTSDHDTEVCQGAQLFEDDPTGVHPNDAAQEGSDATTHDNVTALEEPTDTVNYCDQRVEIGRVILSKLGLRDEGELQMFLRQPWVMTVYKELKTGRSPDISEAAEQVGIYLQSQSPHQWKIERAGFFLSPLSQSSSRYSMERPDTTTWTEDDFDIRFLVRSVVLGSARRQIWEQERRMRGWRVPCEKALWLLLWFKWLHTTTHAQGREMRRLRKKKDKWLNHLIGIEREQQMIDENSVEAAATTSDEVIPSATTAALNRREDVQRQLFLVSEDAHKLYCRSRDARLTLWGVGSTHSATCILVPGMWALSDPKSLAAQPAMWPVSDAELHRTTFSIGAYSFPWARWAAWFEGWPRNVHDLQHFLPPTTTRKEPSQMHGSHLCHHGLCIVPSHVVYEAGRINHDRIACAEAATTLRMYGAVIPKHCQNHHPPCLLQLAALTTYEAFAVQFNVLGVAKDLPARPPLPRPDHHPRHLTTFFEGPGPNTEFPDIGVQPGHIVRLAAVPAVPVGRGFHRNCRFCPYIRTFGIITAYWAHLRTTHRESTVHEILQEVTASAQAYQGWADERSYAYARSNKATWQKIQQAQAPDFDWAVFCGWRLTRIRKQLRGDGLAAPTGSEGVYDEAGSE